MLGVLAGDVIGSVCEFDNIKTKDFPLFREGCGFCDDTVLTVGLVDSVMSDRPYVDHLHEYYQRYSDCSYGARFRASSESGTRERYSSCGNSSAMRVIPVGWACGDLVPVLERDNPEAAKGARAAAASSFMGRAGTSKGRIQVFVEREFGCGVSMLLNEIRPRYRLNEASLKMGPLAIGAFAEGGAVEAVLQRSVFMGGYSGALTRNAGAMAEAAHLVAKDVVARRVPDDAEFGWVSSSRERQLGVGDAGTLSSR